jgi:hypothetical protein
MPGLNSTGLNSMAEPQDSDANPCDGPGMVLAELGVILPTSFWGGLPIAC